VNLDVDWLYRRWAPLRLRNLERGLVSLGQWCKEQGSRILITLIALGPRSYNQDRLMEPKPTSEMLLWVALLLMLFIVLSNI
jgi:hypothetical protein